MAVQIKPQHVLPRGLPDVLSRCADAYLLFDDRAALPASKTLLSIHSPVLASLLDGETALRKCSDGSVNIPMGADSSAGWLVVLKLLYLEDAPLTWGNIEQVVDIMEKYDIRALRPAVHSFMLDANFDDSPAPTGKRQPEAVWQWLILAERCNMPTVVAKCCNFIMARRLEVPRGLDLGRAAQPLAEWLARATARMRVVSKQDYPARDYSPWCEIQFPSVSELMGKRVGYEEQMILQQYR